MQERRDGPPDNGTGAEPIPAADVQLSPVQQAHIAYSRHVAGTKRARGCKQCGDIDRYRCAEGDRLWRAWTDTCDEAYRQLHRGAP